VPFALAPGLANGFYLSGHYLILPGVRRHLGLRPRYDWLAALAIAVCCCTPPNSLMAR
jgi:hypothetical protein